MTGALFGLAPTLASHAQHLTVPTTSDALIDPVDLAALPCPVQGSLARSVGNELQMSRTDRAIGWPRRSITSAADVGLASEGLLDLLDPGLERTHVRGGHRES